MCLGSVDSHFCFVSFCYFTERFIYLFENRTYRDRENISYGVKEREYKCMIVLVYSPDVHNRQCTARKQGLLSCLRHGWHGRRHLGHLLLLFGSQLVGSWIGSRTTRTKTSNHMECSQYRWWL